MTETLSSRRSLTQMTRQNVIAPYLGARTCRGKLHSDAVEASVSQKSPVTNTGARTETTVLAIDLGTTTGWALRARDSHIAHGFVSFKTQRFEGGGMRYLRFKRWLTEMKALAGDVHAVYFEEVRRHVGVDAAHVYGGLMATLTTWCEHHHIPYQGVPVGTIKKHATGKGNASKDEVMAAMRALGHPVTDDNEADALAILHWAIDTQGENT